MMEKILEKAKELGAKYIQPMPDWNGEKVWNVLFSGPDEDTPIIGYPTYFLIEGDKIEVINDDRCLDYIGYVDETYGFTDDSQVKGYENNLIEVR